MLMRMSTNYLISKHYWEHVETGMEIRTGVSRLTTGNDCHKENNNDKV